MLKGLFANIPLTFFANTSFKKRGKVKQEEY